MKERKYIKLNHFILWCKGWYIPVKDDEDRFETLRKVLYLDGYHFITNKYDVMSVVLNFFDEFLSKNDMTLTIYRLYCDVARDIRYYDYDFEEALILAIKSYLCYNVTSDVFIIEKPVYSRKLYRFGLKSPSHFGNTYKHQNLETEKSFER